MRILLLCLVLVLLAGCHPPTFTPTPPVAATIPFDDKFVSNAINSGKPFMMDKKTEVVSRAIQTVVDQMKEKIVKLETPAPEAPAKK